MRFISIILILVLATALVSPPVEIPYAKAETECMDECCDQECHQKNTPDNSCCTNGFCNPLVSCNCCVFCEPENALSITLYASQIQPNTNSDTFLVSEFVSYYWQPPKGI